MNKKKILYIHHTGSIGGASLSLLYLLEKIDHSKYSPSVLCLYKGAATRLYKEKGIKTFIGYHISYLAHSTSQWYRIERPWRLIYEVLNFLPSVYRTYRFIHLHPVDIVHLNSSTLSPCAIGAKWAGCKVVWHIREPLSKGYLGLRRYVLKRIIKRFSDSIIAISQEESGRLIKDNKVKIIYNFVDFKKFDKRISKDEFRKEFSLNEKSKVVGMLGGVAKVKGTFEFVKAARLVLEKIDEASFFIIGPCPEAIPDIALKRWIKKMIGHKNYFQKIKEFIDRYNLNDRIIFTGTRMDVPEVIAGLDVVVFPSTVPHFARPLIEAGAMAKPIVASNFRCLRGLFPHQKVGILVPPANPQELARAITYIFSNPEEAKRMGEEGYRRALNLFDAENNSQKTFKIYEEI